MSDQGSDGAGAWRRGSTGGDQQQPTNLEAAIRKSQERVKRLDWSGYLFASRLADRDNDRPVSGFTKPKTRTDKLVEEAVADWRLHDLRRTAATNMARLGIGVGIIGRALNHASGRGVTGIYDRHSYLPEKHRALVAWAGRLEALLGRTDEARVVPISGGT